MGRKSMKCKREILVAFAILDAFLLGRYALSVVSASLPPESPWWLQARAVLLVPFLLSLAFSAFGLATARRWGFILSYVQFPFRILLMHTTFWFLLVSEFSGATTGSLELRTSDVTPIALECVRLVVTIWIHRGMTTECAVPSPTASL